MNKQKIILYAILTFSIFSVVLFSKDTYAYYVPQPVKDRLADSCQGGRIDEDQYDSTTPKYFDAYSGNNASLTGNWISSDPDGRDLVSSIYKKEKSFEISKSNRSFYLNIAAKACRGAAEASAANVRIQSGQLDADKLEVSGPVSLGSTGQGNQIPARQTVLLRLLK